MSDPDARLFDIVVIGGGASGMMAAITAASSGADVCIVEASGRIGNKILKTGNGRCNLSHDPIEQNIYRGSGAAVADELLKRFGTDETLGFFAGLGLITANRDGYIYPYCASAAAVLDVLRHEITALGVKVLTGYKISRIIPGDGAFVVRGKQTGDAGRVTDRKISARRVILCTGGCADPGSGSDGSGYGLVRDLGIRVIKPLPALVKVITDDKHSASIAGVRARGIAVAVTKDNDPSNGVSDSGEIQFTSDGLSGIPVFNISRYVSTALDSGAEVKIILDLIPQMDEGELAEYIFNTAHRSGGAGVNEYPGAEELTVEDILSGILHKKLNAYICRRMGIRCGMSAAQLSRKMAGSYSYAAKHLEFNITATYGFEQAQVTCGGVDPREVDGDLECVSIPGLYLAGEILDIDGPCGGYNLQWAWTSGHICGEAAAASLC